MIMAFLSVDTTTILVVLLIYFSLIAAMANYGKKTVLGFWGSALLAFFTTPLTAFVIISILRILKGR